MRDLTISKLLRIPHSQLNGHASARLPQNANVSFRFVEGEALRFTWICADLRSALALPVSAGHLKPAM